jgi:hypothetical protein
MRRLRYGDIPKFYMFNLIFKEMKKKIFITVMAIALLAGCAKNEDNGGNPASPDVINFTLNTAGSPSTRAAIVDLTGLQSAPNGFVVYGTSAANPSAWYTTGGPINGTNNYRYAGSAWDWIGAKPTWPAAQAGYPMKFYAYYSSATGTTGVGTVSATPGATPVMTAPFIVPDVVIAQADFLVATATASTKPTGGKLSMTFEHALSKIDFGVIAGVGTTSFIQSVAVNNVGFQRIFDFVDGKWLAEPQTLNKAYTYYGKVTDGMNGSGVIAVRDIAGTNGTTAVPILTASTTPQVALTGHLMLMPQSSATWQPVPNVPAANAYIGLIYRMESIDSDNAIGYKSAKNHPNYAGSALAAKTYEGPLFVKVGYPFSKPSPFTWEKGKGYIYNIYMGTPDASNGYIVDPSYYDDEGNRTDLPVLEPDPKNPGEPINPADNVIHFDVKVSDWADTPPINVQY